MNERALIELVINLGNFNSNQLYYINVVRIKLQVIFVSDLLVINTNWVKECYLKGQKDKFTIIKFK